jgi:hypothetical protein
MCYVGCNKVVIYFKTLVRLKKREKEKNNIPRGLGVETGGLGHQNGCGWWCVV